MGNPLAEFHLCSRPSRRMAGMMGIFDGRTLPVGGLAEASLASFCSVSVI